MSDESVAEEPTGHIGTDEDRINLLQVQLTALWAVADALAADGSHYPGCLAWEGKECDCVWGPILAQYEFLSAMRT